MGAIFEVEGTHAVWLAEGFPLRIIFIIAVLAVYGSIIGRLITTTESSGRESFFFVVIIALVIFGIGEAAGTLLGACTFRGTTWENMPGIEPSIRLRDQHGYNWFARFGCQFVQFIVGILFALYHHLILPVILVIFGLSLPFVTVFVGDKVMGVGWHLYRLVHYFLSPHPVKKHLRGKEIDPQAVAETLKQGAEEDAHTFVHEIRAEQALKEAEKIAARTARYGDKRKMDAKAKRLREESTLISRIINLLKKKASHDEE